VRCPSCKRQNLADPNETQVHDKGCPIAEGRALRRRPQGPSVWGLLVFLAIMVLLVALELGLK
jgi:hypothetical protein